MIQAEGYRVVNGSPGDVGQEREKARASINEWNEHNSKTTSKVLLPVMWEHHATPEMGAHPQQIISKQLLKDSQILIAIFWSKLGTPTTNSISGTVDEIEEFITDGKPVMIYFSSKALPQDIDDSQWQALKEFKKDLQKRGLIDSFDSLEELDKKIKQHLSSVMDKLG